MRQPPDLPNLPSLRALEAVGRLQSFRAAGDELLITQSAVSHHIRKLETDLGVRLFVREARGIRFTHEGERYFHSVAVALDQIAHATREVRIRVAHGKRRLRLSILPSFGRFWLVPRLSAWSKDHQDIELSIDPNLALADVREGDCDLAIRYGTGPWPGVKARLLRKEYLSPILSPTLAARLPSSPGFEDFTRFPRILNAKASDWERWRAKAGSADWPGGDTQLTEYGMVVDAVLAGHGLAMGRVWLLSELLRSNRLVMPLSEIAKPPRLGYWLLRPHQIPNAAADQFEDWILRQFG